jgi:hypothetical protein
MAQDQERAASQLHAAIMNLPCKPYDGSDHYNAYARGHRDARHAAAELVSARSVAVTSLGRAIEWGRLYDAASRLTAYLGAYGTVEAKSDLGSLLIDALHDIDGGDYCPGLMPAVADAAPAAEAQLRQLPGEPEEEYLGRRAEAQTQEPTVIVEELRDMADRITRYSNSPGDGLLYAAANEIEILRVRKDAAYEERNKVVAALARRFPSGVARTAIEGWSEDWHGCVYIDLPTGQVSWHFHDSQAHLFDGLPAYTKPWDGHDTPEKYRRLAALGRHECDGKDPRGCWNVRCQLGGTCCRIAFPPASPADKFCDANCTWADHHPECVRAATAEATSPDFTDTARAALLWVLWHHQGGNSAVGQPIRFALGMGQHDRLTDEQVAAAKTWDEPSPGLAHRSADESRTPTADGMPQKEWLVEAKRLASQMLSDWRMFERDGSVKSTEALAASEKFLGHLSLRLAQPAQPVEIAWTGNDGAHFSLSLESAQAELCALFDRFPNGVDEMEASLSAWRERAVAPAQPAADAARPAAQTALSDEQIAVRGRFDVAVALLRECLGPLEVSAAIIESDDGEPMEALIRRAKTFVSAASAPKEPTEPTDGQMPTPELFRKALRMAQREHLNRHPPRYVNDDQADASMSDDATELTDCYRTAMSHGGTR